MRHAHVYAYRAYIARIIRTTINRLSDARADSYLIPNKDSRLLFPSNKAQERARTLQRFINQKHQPPKWLPT